MLASAENNPLFADVYGLRFDPLSAERITTMKRISTMSADADHVVVAAADGDVDRLAVVSGDGTLVPVPGLGRPYAFSPFLSGDKLYYEIATEDDASRSLAFDLQKKSKRIVFESKTLYGGYPRRDGLVVFGKVTKPGEHSVAVVQMPNGERRELSFGAEVFGGADGKRWLASTINAPDNSFGDKPETLVLLNLRTGKTKRVDGLQAVCWTPDGTKLLARRVGDPLTSPLVLLDPNKPQDLVDLGTVPGLAIYSGTWVRGTVPS
ncbi:MAG: hypothetical protein ACT4P1_16375 [Sporichthyaceae bacterium]